VDPYAVFASNRLNLRDIQVYGFDYDYTLANYKPELEHLIYNLGRDVLINVYKVHNTMKRVTVPTPPTLVISPIISFH